MSYESIIETAVMAHFTGDTTLKGTVDIRRYYDQKEAAKDRALIIRITGLENINSDCKARGSIWSGLLTITVVGNVVSDRSKDILDATVGTALNRLQTLTVAALNTLLSGTDITVDGLVYAASSTDNFIDSALGTVLPAVRVYFHTGTM